jgi:CRISPR/Cas system CMR subunit Cmr6 (Cas7 group RAMP superfamily)
VELSDAPDLSKLGNFSKNVKNRYNQRNPHAMVGEEAEEGEVDFEEALPEDDPQA